MAKITFIDATGQSRSVEAQVGATVMETALRNSVPGIEAECGGACACATCHVYVAPEWTEATGKASQMEEDMLDFAFEVRPNSRLSCQIKVTEALDGLIRTGGSCRVNVNVEPGFAPGDKVMAININTRTHTRLPTYVRGKRGIVIRDHGAFVFPDTNAQLKGEKPQHVYSVMFEAGELWGDAEFPGDKVLIDMFEDYLRPANGK